MKLIDRKRIFFIDLIIIVIIITIIRIVFFIRIDNYPSLVDFTPFLNNNNLIKTEAQFKINENLPKIEAASAFYPFTANLVQTIYNKDSYKNDVVKMVSTSQTFQDLINGEADIIIVTNPSDEQKKLIEESKVNLMYITLFQEPLAIILNKENPIDNMTIEQIKSIYYNSKSNWNNFSGMNHIVNAYQLEKNNGSQTCFENIVKNNNLNKYHHEIKLMPDIIDKVGKDKSAIAYTFYSYYSKMHKNKNVKVIDVDNQNINLESYPLLFNVYLIYRADNSNKNIKEIVNWISSDEGQRIIDLIK